MSLFHVKSFDWMNEWTELITSKANLHKSHQMLRGDHARKFDFSSLALFQNWYSFLLCNDLGIRLLGLTNKTCSLQLFRITSKANLPKSHQMLRGITRVSLIFPRSLSFKIGIVFSCAVICEFCSLVWQTRLVAYRFSSHPHWNKGLGWVTQNWIFMFSWSYL